MIVYKGIEYDINQKQRRFIEEYLKDYNGTQAAIRAGYSSKSAVVHACRMLINDNIKKYLRKRQDELVEDIKLDQLKTLREITKIAFFDPRKFFDEHGNLKEIKDLGDEEAAALAGFEVIMRKNMDEWDTIDKIKFTDRKSALELLATIQGLKIDKSEIKYEEVGVIEMPAKLPDGTPCEVPDDDE